MKISTSIALLCIASAASAQTQSKNITVFKDINDANY